MPQENGPFFSSDWGIGLAILSFLGTLVGVIWGVITRPITNRIKSLEDVIGIKEPGKSRIDILERDDLVMRTDIDGLHSSFDKQQEAIDTLKECVTSLDKNQAILTSEINGKLNLILERGRQRREGDTV